MLINPYAWELYLQARGQEVVNRFEEFFKGYANNFDELIISLHAAFCPDKFLTATVKEELAEAVDWLSSNVVEQNEWIVGQTADEPILLWEEIKKENKDCEKTEVSDKLALAVFSEQIVYFSVIESNIYPGHYFPYFFVGSYHILEYIAQHFEIVLPTMPKAHDYFGRYLHYFELCRVLTQERIRQGWSTAEMCAFLYDFAPKYIGGKEWIWTSLPAPRSVYVIGTSPDYSAFSDSKYDILRWQGNQETQPGDIILLYQWAPVSSFVSVWRAVSPGFYDPFFFYYRCHYIANEMKIPRVTYEELRLDELFRNHPLIRTHMLGMNGTEITPNEYLHIMELLHGKGYDISLLPQIEGNNNTIDVKIETERDVEVKLLEPLLEQLGWKKDQYIRQMPLKMGRGSCVYPDYVIMPKFNPGREKGTWIVEAKKTIPSQRQLEVDKAQASSYAQRLNTKGLVLVSKEGIWVGLRENDYSKLIEFDWESLKKADIFSKLYKLIGNYKK